MPRRKRVWVWIGAVWGALVLAGAGTTLALQPADPPADGDPHGAQPSQPSRPPGARPTVDEECADEEGEARRRAERKGHETYTYLCITRGGSHEPSASPVTPRP